MSREGAVPRRARRVESRIGWVHPHRSLRLTRDGWFFLSVTMAIGFASLNTGHNLFYLIFAMQVSLIIVSGILSERAVRSLRVERRLPREVFARAATPIEIAVRNTSRRRTTYAVEVRDAVDQEPHRRIGFVDRLDPGAERSFHSVWSLAVRGRHEFQSIHLATRFPFGIFEKIRIIPVRREFVVFPAIERGGTRRSAIDLSRAALRKNRLGEELLGLRRKLPEDDRRHIHWRVSARAGELIVREPGDALDRPLSIFFDSRGPAGAAFETAVEHAATVLWQICREAQRVNFYSFDFDSPGITAESWHSALGYLAEVEPAPPIGGRNFDRWTVEVARGGGGVFI
ncbi:MAG: DUF58 domain-containing protein, partial [Candidatus Binatia bacterium]